MKHEKITCDRCERDVADVGNVHRKINYKTAPSFMSSTGSEVKEISFDLCQECMWHFQDIIKDFLKND